MLQNGGIPDVLGAMNVQFQHLKIRWQSASRLTAPTTFARQELAQLRSAGKWLRYLGAKGCYLWIHSLTREVTALRPADYKEDDALSQEDSEQGVAGESGGRRRKEVCCTCSGIAFTSEYYTRQKVLRSLSGP